MICEYYGKKCLYTPVALSLSCENCVVKLAYKNGVIKGRKDVKGDEKTDYPFDPNAVEMGQL